MKDETVCLSIEQMVKLFDRDYVKNSDKIIKILKSLDRNISEIIEENNDIKNIELKLSKNDFTDILLTKNKMFLIDELDSSLHPLLVKGLLQLFSKSNINNQLVITTHELKTLDFDLVRRDEIWFTEKNEFGESRLYSLEEFKDVARFDRKIDKAYMEGRYYK